MKNLVCAYFELQPIRFLTGTFIDLLQVIVYLSTALLSYNKHARINAAWGGGWDKCTTWTIKGKWRLYIGKLYIYFIRHTEVALLHWSTNETHTSLDIYAFVHQSWFFRRFLPLNHAVSPQSFLFNLISLPVERAYFLLSYLA